MAGNNTQGMMSTNTDDGIILHCIVCSDIIHSRPVNICPDCKKPCHTRCATKKANYSCDLCRNKKNNIYLPPSTKKSPAVHTSTAKTRAQDQLSHLRRSTPTKTRKLNSRAPISTPTKSHKPHNSRAPIITPTGVPKRHNSHASISKTTPALTTSDSNTSPLRVAKAAVVKDTSKLHDPVETVPLLASTPAHRVADAKALNVSKRTEKTALKIRDDFKSPKRNAPTARKSGDSSRRLTNNNSSNNTSNNSGNNSDGNSSSNSFSVASSSASRSSASIKSSEEMNLKEKDFSKLHVQLANKPLPTSSPAHQQAPTALKFSNDLRSPQFNATTAGKNGEKNNSHLADNNIYNLNNNSSRVTSFSALGDDSIKLAAHPNLPNLTKFPGPSAASILTEEAAEHIAELTGVTNVLIPVSTLEFLFRRFDMIENQLDELKTLKSKSPASPSFSAALAGTNTADSRGLATKVSALEETIAGQNLLLNELNAKCKLLLEDNAVLKDAFNNNMKNVPTGISSDSPDSGLNESGDRAEHHARVAQHIPTTRHKDDNSEICITNFVNKPHFNFEKAAFAVINTVLPSTSINDIVSCRPAIKKDREGNSDVGFDRPSSLFVKLRSSSLVGDVIRAKQKCNLLHTRDLELSALDQEDASNTLATNIYINEVLNMESFKSFRSLKAIAKSIGFKYVWHRRGSYLVRWRDGERAYVFTSATDLSIIAACYKSPDEIATLTNDGETKNCKTK